MERIYNKLVRDNIPNIIKNNNETPITRILSSDEYKVELEKKLYEEYQEVISSSNKDRLEELADMIEVIKSLAELEKSTLEEVILIAKDKSNKRGSFKDKIFLEKVIDNS
jgi:predicted house-cleaning noncanonical NTP pyrophosphatase (MazG superfamily)